MLDRYQDMLDLPRPPSPSHAPMRRRDRAAQFAPFAALTGFDEQIRKVAWMQRSAFPYEMRINSRNRKKMTKGARREIVRCEQTDRTLLRDLPSQ